MKKLFSVVAVAFSLTIPLSAYAGGHTVDKFMMNDTDGDGLVSKKEFTEKYENKFVKLDSNVDGNVSAEEYEAYMQVKMEEHHKEKFKKMDINGDGVVSAEEMSEKMKSWGHKH